MRSFSYFHDRSSLRVHGEMMSIAAALIVLAVGCASSTNRTEAAGPADPTFDSSTATASAPPIEAIHRRKCGNCHTPVEPGALPRKTIEAAMVRHRTRAKLTDGQWSELIEFLSAPGPVAACPTPTTR